MSKGKNLLCSKLVYVNVLDKNPLKEHKLYQKKKDKIPLTVMHIKRPQFSS